MMFNSALVREIRRKNSIKQADFAKLLAVSESYLSMLENGQREPSISVVQKLVDVTDIPVEKWLSINPQPQSEEISCLIRNEVIEIKNRLNRERRERQITDERVWELEQTVEHLLAEIRLREQFVDIVCAESHSRGDKNKKLKKLANLTMVEGELNFDDIQRVLRIERSKLRSWLETEKRPFECRFADGGKILASSPGEAAICLRCFDCKAFESGECTGHGDEKRPEKIFDILDRLRANGVYDSIKQASILEKHYDLVLSSRDIVNIRYRAKNSLPIRYDILYMDMRKREKA